MDCITPRPTLSLRINSGFIVQKDNVVYNTAETVACHSSLVYLSEKRLQLLKVSSYGATVVEFPSILVVATISLLLGRCN